MTWVECDGGRHWVNLGRASGIFVDRDGEETTITIVDEHGTEWLYGTAPDADTALATVRRLLRNAAARLLLTP